MDNKRIRKGTSDCDDSPCKNGGTCLDFENGHFCVCDAGWSGDNCTTGNNDCADSPCKNGGTCLDLENGHFCVCAAGWTGDNCATRFKDCAALQKSVFFYSGTYVINPDGKGSMEVYCDMKTEGGGWTVIQRRVDNSTDFYRDWASYKVGFGSLRGNFWLGNDYIHRLTASGDSVLRVNLEDWDGNTAYAKYGLFRVDDESNKYKLTVSNFSGTAGDSLALHNGMYFTTKDRQNDVSNNGNCARQYTGAWWFKKCYRSHLNGKYLGNTVESDGVEWKDWKGNWLSMMKVEMKIRAFLLQPIKSF